MSKVEIYDEIVEQSDVYVYYKILCEFETMPEEDVDEALEYYESLEWSGADEMHTYFESR